MTIMIPQTFSSVFRKIPLSYTLQSALCSTTITNIIISKSDKELELHLTSKEILNYPLLQQLKEELFRLLPVETIKIIPFFQVQELSDGEIIERYWENISYKISEQSPVCKGVIKDSFWKVEQKKIIYPC